LNATARSTSPIIASMSSPNPASTSAALARTPGSFCPPRAPAGQASDVNREREPAARGRFDVVLAWALERREAAGFGPWPTVGPSGVTAFIAALDGGHGPLAAFAGEAGDIMRVATMGETLPQGERIGRFALNAVAVAGPGGALTFSTVAQEEGERNAIYCRCPGPAR